MAGGGGGGGLLGGPCYISEMENGDGRWECKSHKEEKDSSALELLTSWGRRGWQEKRQQQQWNGDPEVGGTGGRAHTGQWTLSPGCREGFLEQRMCRQAENRSYLGKICAREQGQCVRRLLSGMKRGSGGLGVAWPRAKVQEAEASTRFS